MTFDPEANPEYWDKVIRFFLRSLQGIIRSGRELPDPLTVYGAFGEFCMSFNGDSNVEEVSKRFKYLVTVLANQRILTADDADELFSEVYETQEANALRALIVKSASTQPSSESWHSPALSEAESTNHPELVTAMVLHATDHVPDGAVCQLNTMFHVFNTIWWLCTKSSQGAVPTAQSVAASLLASEDITVAEATISAYRPQALTIHLLQAQDYSRETIAFAVKTMARSIVINSSLSFDEDELFDLLDTGDTTVPVSVAAKMITPDRVVPKVEQANRSDVERFTKLYECLMH